MFLVPYARHASTSFVSRRPVASANGVLDEGNPSGRIVVRQTDMHDR